MTKTTKKSSRALSALVRLLRGIIFTHHFSIFRYSHNLITDYLSTIATFDNPNTAPITMKLSTTIILATMASASAFAPATSKASFTVLRMVETNSPMESSASAPEVPKARALTKMSTSLPFQVLPAILDGSMAGDVGFDPAGFAKSEKELMNYREAEIKHARLAMLAAAGWPLSELWDAKIANLFGMDPIVDYSDRAPSILNGGLGKISPLYWIICLVGAGFIDVYAISKGKSNTPNYFPGNLSFDPLEIYPKDKAGQMRMQTMEIKNGRLAMLAITAFAFQEAVSSSGVIQETPFFFQFLGGIFSNGGIFS
jgi:hypothetical protein